MVSRILGFVSHVTRHVGGSIEVEFFDFEQNKILTFPNSNDELPRDIVTSLADSLGRNLWAKIEYRDGKLESVSFEEYNFQKDVYRLREKLNRVWKGYLERV
jgi:hypothetical protein